MEDRSFTDEEQKSCIAVCRRVALYKTLVSLNKERFLEKIEWDENIYGEIPKPFRDKYPTDFKMKSPKEFCNSISACCFQLDDHICDKNSSTLSCSSRFLHDPIIRCQKNCFNEKVPLDTFWNEAKGKCYLTNTILKYFCLHPRSTDKKSPPLSWDPIKNSCSFSKEYCEYYGENFDESEAQCGNNSVVNFFENYLFGKVISRTVTHPTILFRDKAHFDCKNYIVRNRRSAGDVQQQQQIVAPPSIPQNSAGEKITDYAKHIIYPLAPDLFLFTAKKSLQSTMAVAETLPALVENSLLLSESLNIATRGLLNPALRLITAVSNPVSTWLFIISVLGEILDIVDPYGMKYEVGVTELNATIQKFKDIYDHTYPKLEGEEFSELTPELYAIFQTESLGDDKYVYSSKTMAPLIQSFISTTDTSSHKNETDHIALAFENVTEKYNNFIYKTHPFKINFIWYCLIPISAVLPVVIYFKNITMLFISIVAIMFVMFLYVKFSWGWK